MRVISSLAVRYTAFVVMLLIASCAIVDWPKRDFGTVAGVTLFVIKGHPGALTGKPDPGYKAPEPKITPNEKLFWLRIDREKGNQLFVTTSDAEGRFEIILPPGEYLVEPAATHEVDLRRIKADEKDVLINTLFPPWRIDGKPDLQVEKGRSHKMDIEARILFVD